MFERARFGLLTRGVRVCTTAVYALMLGGCADVPSATGAVAPSAQGFISGDLHGPLLYISDYANNVVEVYSQRGKEQVPIGKLTGLDNPTGVAIAPNGDVYVSNYTSETISVFHKSQTMPYKSLQLDTNYGGTNVAIAGGVVYAGTVTNIIDLFAHGSTSPTSSLTDLNLSHVYSIAVDGAGDVFDMGVGSSRTLVDEFPAGSSSAATLPIAVSSEGQFGGLAIDAEDNLYVDDCGAEVVSVYAPPYTAAPIREISYSGGAAYGLVLQKHAKGFWLASRGLDAGLRYNLNGKLLDETSSSGLSQPYGIAVSPPNHI